MVQLEQMLEAMLRGRGLMVELLLRKKKVELLFSMALRAWKRHSYQIVEALWVGDG